MTDLIDTTEMYLKTIYELDEAQGGDVPEGGGAAVAERDLVPVGRAEQLRDTLTDTAHQILYGRLPV